MAPHDNANKAPPPLTQGAVLTAVDGACRELQHQKWKLRRATTQDLGRVDETLLYGAVASDEETYVLATFYFAYSTWDGRFLYLDRLKCDDYRLVALFHCVLANIAVRLHCTRFTWQHFGELEPLKYPGEVEPERLDEWLTLHWGPESLLEFLSQHGSDLVEPSGCSRPMDYPALQRTINKCLEQQSNEKLSLKLATAMDVNDIGRLVQGLAEYEKEPDAVNTTVETYRRDGFEGRPIFHCIILNHINDDGTFHACGMAFCYLGFDLSEGLFLYLDDLFIEEEYRGKGAGTTVMKALASIGYALKCSRIVWQALVCLARPALHRG